jgi:aspartyl protease family protein
MNSKRVYQLQRHGNLLWLRAAVSRDDKNSIVIRLLVDTGSSFTVLSAQILERLGCNLNQPQNTTTIVTAGGVINVPMIVVPWFNCLGKRRKNFPVVALNLPAMAFTNGLLGMDFLRDCQAVIAVEPGEIHVGLNN